jgi:hypothetical protein
VMDFPGLETDLLLTFYMRKCITILQVVYRRK